MASKFPTETKRSSPSTTAGLPWTGIDLGREHRSGVGKDLAGGAMNLRDAAKGHRIL